MTEKKTKTATVKSVTKLEPGAKVTLSDFQVSASDQDGQIFMVNMDVDQEEEEDLSAYEVRPGAWRVTPKSGLQPLEMAAEQYFETETSQTLRKHFDVFRNKLERIRERKRFKRSVLLGSAPGIGKSSLVRSFCREVMADSAVRSCILRVDSDDVSWELLTQMFMKSKASDADFVILILEDVGGTALDERRHHVDAACLNFLDGNSDVFKVPTLVVATTNFMNELGHTLTDRPGRFDVVMHVEAPKDSEVFKIVSGYLGRELTKGEEQALAGQDFTPAYCLEAVDRSDLYDISIEEAVGELRKQRDKSQNRKHGNKSTNVGFGVDDD